jgi:hypothetical protein
MRIAPLTMGSLLSVPKKLQDGKRLFFPFPSVFFRPVYHTLLLQSRYALLLIWLEPCLHQPDVDCFYSLRQQVLPMRSNGGKSGVHGLLRGWIEQDVQLYMSMTCADWFE